MEDIHDADCVIVAVAHDSFKKLTESNLREIIGNNLERKVLIDVKGIYDANMINNMGIILWRL